MHCFCQKLLNLQSVKLIIDIIILHAAALTGLDGLQRYTLQRSFDGAHVLHPAIQTI